jgi:hypothetical protein
MLYAIPIITVRVPVPVNPRYRRLSLVSRTRPSGVSRQFTTWDNFLVVQQHKRRKRKPELDDREVRDVLVHAMADVGADPGLVYAFQKTGIYVCDENEKRLPKSSLKAFDAALDEYFSTLKRPLQ